MRFTKGGKFYFSPDVWEFNLPAGHACPGAVSCLMKADRMTGKIVKGDHMQFPCYAATTERYPSVRTSRWKNLEDVRHLRRDELVEAFTREFPKKAKLVRVHASGDFISPEYFAGWMMFAKTRPDVRFWAFTKSVRLWVFPVCRIPANFALTASLGGRDDELALENGLRWCKVFPTRMAAQEAGLPVDDDDTIPSTPGTEPFALVLRSEVAREKRSPGLFD